MRNEQENFLTEHAYDNIINAAHTKQQITKQQGLSLYPRCAMHSGGFVWSYITYFCMLVKISGVKMEYIYKDF